MEIKPFVAAEVCLLSADHWIVHQNVRQVGKVMCRNLAAIHSGEKRNNGRCKTDVKQVAVAVVLQVPRNFKLVPSFRLLLQQTFLNY